MNKKLSFLIIILLYIILAVISLITENIHYDEKGFHLPTLELFSNNDILKAVTSPAYKSASTPVPYIIASLSLKILNLSPSLFSARLINIFVSLLSLFIFLKLFSNKELNIIYPSLILFFYPYFLKPSFTFFMSIYGLLFFLLFIYFVDKNSSRSIFISGFFLALAVLCQQFYLIVFVFYSGYILYKQYRLQNGAKTLQVLISFVAPVILPVIIFLLWGGLTHPGYREWGVEFHFENLTSVIVLTSSALFPFLIFKVTGMNKTKIAVVVSLSIFMVIFIFPQWANAPAVNWISGYTFQALAIVNEHSGLAAFILKVLLCFLGISSFIIFYEMIRDDKSRLLYFLFIVLAIGFSLNKLPSERHMLPLAAVGYLFVLNNYNGHLVMRFWLGFQIIIGGIYFYYIMFVYSI